MAHQLLVAVLLLLACSLSLAAPARPRYPFSYDSTWDYFISFPAGPQSPGPIRWAGTNGAMYFNMTPLNWEQIVTGNVICNFYRSNSSCYNWTFTFDVVGTTSR